MLQAGIPHLWDGSCPPALLRTPQPLRAGSGHGDRPYKHPFYGHPTIKAALWNWLEVCGLKGLRGPERHHPSAWLPPWDTGTLAPRPLGCPLRPRPPRAAAAPLTQAPVGFERFIGIKLKSVPNCLKCNQNKAGLNQKLEQALSKPQQPQTSPRGAPGTDPPPCARTRPRGHPQPLPTPGNNPQKLQPRGGGAAPTGGVGIPPLSPLLLRLALTEQKPRAPPCWGGSPLRRGAREDAGGSAGGQPQPAPPGSPPAAPPCSGVRGCCCCSLPRLPSCPPPAQRGGGDGAGEGDPGRAPGAPCPAAGARPRGGYNLSPGRTCGESRARLRGHPRGEAAGCGDPQVPPFPPPHPSDSPPRAGGREKRSAKGSLPTWLRVLCDFCSHTRHWS